MNFASMVIKVRLSPQKNIQVAEFIE